jgi:hypothetical protein
VVDVGGAFHRIWAVEVNFGPEALKLGISTELRVARVRKPGKYHNHQNRGRCNGIPDRFGSGKSDEITNEGWVHRIDQHPLTMALSVRQRCTSRQLWTKGYSWNRPTQYRLEQSNFRWTWSGFELWRGLPSFDG